MNVITEKDLQKIMDKNSMLGRHGFGKGKYGRVKTPDELEKNEEIKFDEFKKCVQWMSENLEIKQIGSKFECESYEIKHMVENDLGGYIPNGAAIAAGIFLDIPIARRTGQYVNFRAKSKVKQTRF